MVDQVRSESIVDLMIYVMDCFNLPIPDEGGLLYKLKAIGLKVGKQSYLNTPMSQSIMIPDNVKADRSFRAVLQLLIN